MCGKLASYGRYHDNRNPPMEKLPKYNIVRNNSFIMPPTSKKLRGHIGLGLSVRQSVCPSVRLSVRNTFWKLRNSRTPYARILKFYIWHIHEK